MDLDLAIVGGGPAGIATALFLVAVAPQLRHRIAVLERDHYPREKVCAGAIGGRADKLLATIGVRVDVPSVTIRGLSVVGGSGALDARDPARGAEGIGRVVRRVEFDHAFAEQARARGIRVVEGAKVTRVEERRDGVVLDGSGGEIRARAVVGADGVGSFVRRAMGVPRGRWTAQVVETDTSSSRADVPRDLLHFDVTDRTLYGYAWDFPTIVGGLPLFCRGVYQLRADAARETGTPSRADGPEVGARLLARLEKLGISSEGVTLKRFAERGLARHEPLARHRMLLVGEAAGIDPALGEGIAQAIAHGAIAGRYLARCFAESDLSFRGWPRVFWRSRVGVDLLLRSTATPWIYGAPRPFVERWVASSRHLSLSGMRYFAGEHVPRARLVGASFDLARAVVSTTLDRATWRAS